MKVWLTRPGASSVAPTIDTHPMAAGPKRVANGSDCRTPFCTLHTAAGAAGPT